MQSSVEKSPLRDKISSKYLDVIRNTNLMYDAVADNMRKAYKTKRNELGAQSAISKSNTAASLAQKGLWASGESVQSSILGDMAYMGALTSLAKDESDSVTQLNAQRQAAVSDIQKDMINAQNQADMQQAEMDYQKERDKAADEKWNKEYEFDVQNAAEDDARWNKEFEYNSQRDTAADEKWKAEQEYKKERDTQSDMQWQSEFDYKAQRDSEADKKWEHEQDYRANRDRQEDAMRENEMAYQRERDSKADKQREREFNREIYENDRDYQFEVDKFDADLAQQEFENQMAQDELNMQKSKIGADNYYKSQYLAMEQEKHEREMAESAAEESKSAEYDDFEVTYYVNEKGYVVPNKSPDEFIDDMIKGSGNGTATNAEFVTPKRLEERMNKTLNNERLDPDYRAALEIYARARGIIS